MVRRTSLVALVVLVLTAGAFAAEAQKDAFTTLKDAGNYTVFLGLVEKAGLTDSLKAAGPITVLAVDNARAALLEAADKMPKEKSMEHFKVTMQRHIISGKVMAADVAKMKEMKFEGKTTEPVTAKDGKVSIGSVNVIKSDIMASNGVIHDVDGFLTKPGVGEPKEAAAATAGPKAVADEAAGKAAVKAANEEERAAAAEDRKANAAESEAARKAAQAKEEAEGKK